MQYNFSNHQLYELITRFSLEKIKLVNGENNINSDITKEIDLIVKFFKNKKEITLTKEKKINNDDVYALILLCYEVNSNLRPFIHKRVNIEDNYFLISCVVNALVDCEYASICSNKLIINDVEFIFDILYRVISVYFALENLKNNQYLALLFIYIHNADFNQCEKVDVSSIIELIYNDIDFLIGEKQGAKQYIQAFKKLPYIIEYLGGSISYSNDSLYIDKSFAYNITFVNLNDEEDIIIEYKNIELENASKIYEKVITSF